MCTSDHSASGAGGTSLIPEKRNVETLREANRLWHESRGGSAAHWISIVASDLTMMSLADGARNVNFSKPRLSRDGLRAYLDDLTRDWSMNYHRIDDYIAQGDKVADVGEVSWNNKATGKTVTTKRVTLWTFNGDGQIVDFLEMYDTAALFVAATPDA